MLRKIKFNRSPSEFFGDSVVIGCGQYRINTLEDKLVGTHHLLHSNSNYFYSIDAESTRNPDCELTIEKQGELDHSLKGKFNFVFLECLPYDVYMNRGNAKNDLVFNNQQIESLLGDDGVIYIDGFNPTRTHDPENYTVLRGEILVDRFIGRNSCRSITIIIKAPHNVDPTLVLMSLNPDARKLINSSNPNIENNLNYSPNVNGEFIKQKAMHILGQQINKLNAEQQNSFLGIGDTRKQKKIKVLRELQEMIRTSTAETMREIIEDAKNKHPDLIKGFFRHNVLDALDTILNMVNYHEAKVLISGKNSMEIIPSPGMTCYESTMNAGPNSTR